MAIYRYVKRFPASLPAKKKKISSKKLALLLIGTGLVFFGNSVYPIVSYQLFVAPKFSSLYVSPTVESDTIQNFGLPQKVYGQEIDLVDFTKAENWFTDAKAVFSRTEEGVYHLSIPSLGIGNAVVSVGIEDLKKSLIQYPGTAVPGKYGNTVVFGHSVLPQFFNPKNYLTIFSTLPKLKPKSEIIIDYNQVKYKYVVEKMIEVPPSDTSILAQRYDDSYLTLITCVPPGTYFKRLIVRARLDRI